METTSQNDEKLSLFAHPLTFAITHLAFPILAPLACVYLYWITCDALEGVLASKALAVLLPARVCRASFVGAWVIAVPA